MVKDLIKKHKIVYLILKTFYKYLIDFQMLLSQSLYFVLFKLKFWNMLKKSNTIVVKMDFGGLGDCLKYSTLPELLKNKYGKEFYLHESNRTIFRNESIYKLVFERNPYFKGFLATDKYLEPKILDKIFGKHNAVLSYEKLFGVEGTGRPKIYYTPKEVEFFRDKVVIDKNHITGARLGYVYSDESIKKVIQYNKLEGFDLYYINPEQQTLEEYIDIVYSCKYFICYMSGSGVIAAALDKNATVLLPDNIPLDSRAIFPWIFKECRFVKYFHRGRYI